MASVSRVQVQEFWDWFASISDELGANLENHEILEALDRWILSFGDLTWEVGPGTMAPNALAISPNGQKEFLAVTNEMVAAAPKCPGWEFHPAKPPKDWRLQFVLEDAQGEPVEVDASGWQYALLGFPDGTFDIVVRVDGLPHDEDLRHRAADIAIEGQLGEETMLQYVQGLEIVSELEGDLAGKGNSIRVLPDHLAALVKAK